MNNFWPKWQENKIFTILVALLLLIVVIAVGIGMWNAVKQHYYIGKSTDIARTITISGEGKVVATPDLAVINLGYLVEKKNVTDAQKDNTDKINALIKNLKDLGIQAKDIKTTNYNVYPQYDYADGKQILRGYQVSQNVEVKVRDSEKISTVLDLVGSLGLNQVGGLTFQIDEPEIYQQEARIKALANAKEKAKDLAAVMGVKLGKIISFNEDTYPVSPIYSYAKSEALGMGGDMAAPALSVESGSQEIIVNASISYELD